MADKKSFIDAVKSRRTVYALNKNMTISRDRLEEIIRTVIDCTPTAFNDQGTRTIVLTGKEHDTLWEIVKGVMKAQFSQEQYESMGTEKRLDQLVEAYGTALFFEDPAPKKDFQSRFKPYADHFDEWSHQGSGMAQYVLWTALAAEGCGRNLQHFNPVIDAAVKDHWDIDMEWRLTAQLVLGGKKEGWKENLKEKFNYYEVEERYRVL